MLLAENQQGLNLEYIKKNVWQTWLWGRFLIKNVLTKLHFVYPETDVEFCISEDSKKTIDSPFESNQICLFVNDSGC